MVAAPPVAAAAPVAAGERSVRVREVGPGWYVAYMLFWRGPLTIGDALLTALWNGIARLQGRSEERYPLRSTQMDGHLEWTESDERSTGEY